MNIGRMDDKPLTILLAAVAVCAINRCPALGFNIDE